MTSISILGEAQLRELVPLDLAAIDQVEAAFLALATEAVAMPPILRLDLPEQHGEVDVKTAYLPRFDGFAIKVSTGFFNNPALGLPSLNGLMLVLSAKTGLTEAVLLDNGYLTAVRTAAAGAVAARWLAKHDTPHVAVIGAGEQARLQLQALTLVRRVERVSVWARNRASAERFATEMTTTPSRTPLIEAADLHPGLHITAMGSDAEHKNEIAPAALAAARYICDRVQQTRVLGELHHALEAGVVSAQTVFAELGQVIAGRAVGRTHASDVTICDLTGTGAQDTAIATLALARVREAGAGTIFRNEVKC
jgi:ornithine cyclodeaminase